MVNMLHLIHLSLLRLLYCFLIIFRSLALLKSNRPCRASWQAVAKAVTEVLPDQFCLPIYDVNRPFMAGICAQPAAITLLFINLTYSVLVISDCTDGTDLFTGSFKVHNGTVRTCLGTHTAFLALGRIDMHSYITG